MPADVWYGGDCETRIGRRANLETAPTVWQNFEFLSLTITPAQEWRERTKLGNPGIRKNVLDPTRPRKGFFRLTGELVVDADTRQLPLLLRAAMGPPSAAVANGELFDHTFESGSKAEQYFDLAIKVGDNDIRVFEGLTMSQLSTQFTGENTQDFNLNISLAPQDLARSARLSEAQQVRLFGGPGGCDGAAAHPASGGAARRYHRHAD